MYNVLFGLFKVGLGLSLFGLDLDHKVLASTAPVLLADCVTTGNGLKMASTADYNLSDNHRYSIANFNFNLTLIPCSS